MKKTGLALFAFAMLATTLTGCKDATAEVSEGSDKLVSIGDTSITKEKIYELLKQSAGSSTTLQLIQEKIYDKEGIKLTDAMKKEGKENLKTLKKSIGGEEAFKSAITGYGFKDEQDYLEKATYPSLQSKELLKKYTKDNQSTLFDKYHPVKANILQVAKKEDAEKALKALKDGDSVKDVVKKYGKTDTYDGSEAIYHTESGLPEVVTTKIKSASNKGLIKEVIADTVSETSGETYYIVNLTNIDPKSFAEEALEALQNGVSDLSGTMLEYYLKKHNFTIYDIDIYNQVKSSNESYIVQD